MTDTTHTTPPRARRFWFNEALIVVAVLGFGAYALASEAHLSADDFLAGISSIVGF